MLVTVNGRNLYINHAGIDYDSAVLVIKKTLKMGNIPEPVRMAHLIATAIKTGESHAGHKTNVFIIQFIQIL